MQALVLVGGEGTRLRPLTRTCPKPVIRLVDRPFLAYMLEWLSGHGVDDVILACGAQLGDIGDRLDGNVPARMQVRTVVEEEALGTAGPLRLAADKGLLDEKFLMLNGDLLTDLDLAPLLAAGPGADGMEGVRASIGLYAVEDPSSFGLVLREGGPDSAGAVPAAGAGTVREFLEKPEPAAIVTDEVNAGVYFLTRDVAEMVEPGRAVSIEREVFPLLAEAGELHGVRLEGYWRDIGTPDRYLDATWDILEGRLKAGPWARIHEHGGVLVLGAELEGNAPVEAPAYVAPGCEIAGGGDIGPRAVIGPNTHIGERVTVIGSVVGEECRLGAGVSITGAIVGPRTVVGTGAHIGSGAVIGEGALIEPGARVEPDGRVEPGETVSSEGAGPA